MSDRGKIKLFANRSGIEFAEKISRELSIPLSEMQTVDFADTESKPIIKETVRGCDVYLIQNCFDPNTKRSVQDNFFEFLATGEALVGAGCYKLTGILPYHPYGRQDKRNEREPLTMALIAQFVEAAGFDNLFTADLHSEQSLGFYRKTKIDNLHTNNYLIKYLKENFKDFLAGKIKTIAPDANGAKRAEKYARNLGIKAAQAFKMRDLDSPNKVDYLKIVGLVDDRNILIVDDMIDTAGSVEKLIERLNEIGVDKVIACCTHSLLNGKAIERIQKYNINLITTDTIPRTEEFKKQNRWYEEVSIAPLFAEAILNLNQNKSISDLYNNHA